jgi:hypothetical protein
MISKKDATLQQVMSIKAALDLVHANSPIFEIRIPKTKHGTIAGYFNDTAVAAALIARESGKHPGIYTTVNAINPALLARCENRLDFGTYLTTTDSDVERRHWFLIDLDPVRPAGISSSDAELALSETKAGEIVEWLTSIGWPEPVRAISGNGSHLMYRVDEPNDDAARTDFECATKMIASIFSDEAVKVDITVWNASRVWKIYGTVSAKGSSTVDRPHRMAELTQVPKVVEALSRSLIDKVAAPLRDAKADEYRGITGEYIVDIVEWLAKREQKVIAGPRPMFGNEGQKWLLDKCPFNPNHQTPMVGLVSNRPVFRCLHDSCSAFRWREFREKIDPEYKSPETLTLRLTEWCNGDHQTIEQELLQSACASGKLLNSIIKHLKTVCVRSRVLLLEDIVKNERRRFAAATIGENNEKGNIVGVINKLKVMQEEGLVPRFWTASYDSRIRCGAVGDIDARRITEGDEIAAMVRYHTIGETWVKQAQVAQAIKFVAEEHHVNPLKVYLKSFKWDGRFRLDTWLIDYLGCKDTPYTRSVGRKWLISAVARGMEPGCQADHMLIFEGAQGIGKSQALRALGGGFYVEFSGSITGGGTSHKDFVAAISGKLIVEMSELTSVKKADMESLKAMITTTHDEVRLSYERDSKNYPRTAVLAGSTNQVGMNYIVDSTGARRFWPVLTGEIKLPNIPALKRDRDELWAEAIEAYDAGEDWYSVPQEEVAAEQADRQQSTENSDPWFLKVRGALTDPVQYENEIFTTVPRYVNGQVTGMVNIRCGAMHTVLGALIGIDMARQSVIDGLRLRNVLRAIGFRKVRPNKKWQGMTYTFDLCEDDAPELWPSIMIAQSMMKFPRTEPQED